MRRRSKHENIEKREIKYGNIRIEENSLKHSIYWANNQAR